MAWLPRRQRHSGSQAVSCVLQEDTEEELKGFPGGEGGRGEWGQGGISRAALSLGSFRLVELLSFSLPSLSDPKPQQFHFLGIIHPAK